MPSPEAEVSAVNISPDAGGSARTNIEEHGLIRSDIPIRSNLFRELAESAFDQIMPRPHRMSMEDVNLP